MSSARKSCPICRKAAVARFAPFCSSRCADEDLGRWMSGAYRIPAGTGDESADDSSADPSPDPDRPQ